MSKTVLLGILIVATVAAAYMLLRPAAGPQITTTGIYADDWMSQCASLQGAAQNACTARLDAAYGRSAGVPVVPPSR